MLKTEIILTRAAVAALLAVATFAPTGVASAAAAHHNQHVHANSRSSVALARRPGGGPVVKPVTGGTTVVAISAFPTGGKGSGTEATCALWSGQLQEDQGAVEGAEEANNVKDYKEAKASLDEDVNNALDAGCVVID